MTAAPPRLRAVVLAALLACTVLPSAGRAAAAGAVRRTTPLLADWRFVQDDALADDAALAASGTDWQPVALPHTWNARDAASTAQTGPDSTPYKRGRGWYRLEFDHAGVPANAWLQFDGAAIVADAWLNGRYLGRHRGAFTAFRFDVTGKLAAGRNVLLVKVDNSAPVHGDDPTAVAPLGGDFNISGGLYRGVALIETPARTHLALGDHGASGVVAETVALRPGRATLRVRATVENVSDAGTVRAALIDAAGRTVASGRRPVRVSGAGAARAQLALDVARPRPWQGTDDPYLYRLRVDLLDRNGRVIDRVEQPFGIRTFRFDARAGLFLNGRHLRLHGVNLHQDWQDKAWAIGPREIDASLAIAREMGANAVRLAHYPHAAHAYDEADRLGLVVWSELPFVERSLTPADCKAGAAIPPAFLDNLDDQLREMIRQQVNHPGIAMWSIANEVAMGGTCRGTDTVTPVLHRLHALAKREDPGRPTTLADFNEDYPVVGPMFPVLPTGGITDIWAVNRYHLWYYPGGGDAFGAALDRFHAKYPAQPLGVSEYGAGAALTQQTDNPLGGLVGSMDMHGRARTVHQPEGYANHVHEQVYAALAQRDYLWGTFVWSMFDFGSGTRHEGDIGGTNTKGLVTFDRATRKDPFYFYKANWSDAPVTYITGRRYTARAYRVTDVRVYSNADTVRLTLNGRDIGVRSAAACPLRTCVFPGVVLAEGANRIEARGTHGTHTVTDTVAWTLAPDNARNVYLAAGQVATGLVSKDGHRYGSDNYFVGGQGTPLELDSPYGTRFGVRVANVTDPADAALWAAVRHGTFGYRIPLDDGRYRVTLGFLDPDRNAQPGTRRFRVDANGVTRIDDLDIVAAAGAPATALVRSFEVDVADGSLRLDFVPQAGEAVLSNLVVERL
ncbi:malectin domain-containing carbohydrate-binding protein [Telluria mixta]|uniref:Malectin domain-containing carbohydrate-binding protein n=1 Tax=Telluria mixta TaxID=34071 RepID=A0ABT2BYH0_9BURK|nr:glycoside hydrolase family 2 TIM barrel-domain containing protein [Telluria mixta]MCS0630193.1 malectin domain-containing carbohydrate-binding protein [Telluria mixta]WEM94493.1 glycoside hydrolase family 2 TIM barrel-domain containing protein [Telluria mixta]